MLESGSSQRSTDWERELGARVAKPLRPETLQSVFMVIPGNSGDAALATSVVRYIKDKNPHCAVSFGVKKANVPLLRLCPGVDEVVEVPGVPRSVIPSRQNYLARYAGRAEAVIYPICIFEDIGLLRRFNFLETIWLLAGIEGGMPERPHTLWLTPPDDPEIAAGLLRRCLSEEHASQLAAEALRQPTKVLGELLRQRQVRNIGWTQPQKLRGHAAFVRGLAAQTTVGDVSKQFVIVSSEANAMSAPPKKLFAEIIRHLRESGRIVLQNVLDPAQASPGTVPLVCSYEEFLCLRAAGIPFVGWRSGLCDIAAASQTPMCVLYPSSMEGCSVGLQANCEAPIKSFGFEAMNVGAHCVEIVVDSVANVDFNRIVSILD